MDAKLEQLETTLNNINVFNAGKKREEAVALLAQLLPEVESFQAEIQRMQEATEAARYWQRHSEKECAELQTELQKERNYSFQQRTHISALESRCRKAEKLLKQFPPEVIKQIKISAYQQER